MRRLLALGLGSCSFTPAGAPVVDGVGGDAGEVSDSAGGDAGEPPDAPPCELVRTSAGTAATRVGGAGGESRPVLDCGADGLPIGLSVALSGQATQNGERSLAAVTLRCAAVRVGPAGTADLSEPAFAGGGCCGWTPATASPWTTCPAGAVMSGLAAHVGAGAGVLLEVAIVCQPVGPGAVPMGAATVVSVAGSGDSALTTDLDTSVCTAGQVMTSVGVRGGAGVNALTPRCAPLRCRP